MSEFVENIIREEMGTIVPMRYINYAKYVAGSRALPDIRDGLKPVHRRIIYDMLCELQLRYNSPRKKSARVVGDVLGKFHPHGDTSVYEAMVILSQEFSTRYPLVDGEGNFGSVDGDGAAAMRYTLARLTKFGEALLRDINKDTVDFKDNYDQEEKEPVVLPSLIPQLLCNGSEGIAVGMKSKIPSHNIKDVYAACYYIINQLYNEQEVDEDEVIRLINAPDFATGGAIIGMAGVREAYKTGKGKITIRSKYHIEEHKKNCSIVITEIPYKVNKANMITEIRNLCREVKNSKGNVIKPSVFPQIKDINDESDKDGMRIVIELKNGESPEIVINNLIKKKTGFQITFSVNMIALVDGVPKELNLMEVLNNFLAHATSVILRKAQFDLDKSNKRLNIVSGILKCFERNENGEEKLYEVIETIRTAEDPVTSLMELGFNKEQAEYIAEMKVRSLSKASFDKLTAEQESLTAIIDFNNQLLTDNHFLLSTLEKEFRQIEEEFGDDRRTDIELDVNSIEEEDLIKEETLIVTYTNEGIIKAVEEGEYKSQKRGGKGVKGTNTKDDEIIKFMFTTSSKDDLLFFTTEGRCHVLKAYKIGKSSKSAKGRSINNYLQLNVGEKIVSVLNTNIKNKENHLFFVTAKGQVKKLSLEQLSNRYTVTKIMNFKENDYLVQALLLKDEDQVLIVTAKGQGIRINPEDPKKQIRPMGRTASGVSGINVADDDIVVDMCTIKDEDVILTVTENGLGKRTEASEFKVIGRGAKGVQAHKLSDKTGNVVAIEIVDENKELFVATKKGIIARIPITGIRLCGRSSSGVKIINLNEGDTVATISAIEKEDQYIEEE